MPSGQVELRASLPTLASLDEEFGGANKQLVPEQEHQPKRPRRHYICFFLVSIAALGATSAAIWPNSSLQLLFGQTLQTTNRSSAGSQQLIELEEVNRDISQLRDWQQQISAEITALQTAQQDMHRSFVEMQRSSVEAVFWYSERNALTYRQAVVAPKPKAAAVRTERAVTQLPPARREANAESGKTQGLPSARSAPGV